jgi:transposase
MIGLPSGARVWLACGVIDLRNGFDGLAGLVQTALPRMHFPASCLYFVAGAVIGCLKLR